MTLFLYEILIRCYGLAIKCVSPFSPKAKKWVLGRRDSFKYLQNARNQFIDDKWIWIHVASLGEFEQARYLIELIKNGNTNTKIALSFYSPSGYESRKDYPLADYVFYMPIDTKANAKKTISILRPTAAIFVKYDFWWHHLSQLHISKVPTYFISATIRKDHYFVKYPLFKFRNILRTVNHFFVQTESDAEELNSIAITQHTVCGDTRLDSIINEVKPLISIKAKLKKWIDGQKCIIYGSVHLSDIEVVEPMSKINNAKHIIVPHDIDIQNVNKIGSALNVTALSSESDYSEDHIIINEIGVLRHIYDLADLVYIGGGFGNGIHNILEPLVSLVPIIIGPKYEKFPEAVILNQSRAIRVIKNKAEAIDIATEILSSNQNELINAQSFYINQNKGATRIVYNVLHDKIL